MSRKPHILHLEIDKGGWLTWSLDCPYSATEVDTPVGRNCNLLTENNNPSVVDDDGEMRRWVPTAGCFAKESLDEVCWEDCVHLGLKDPSFPMEVDIEVDGYEDDANAIIVPWQSAEEGE